MDGPRSRRKPGSSMCHKLTRFCIIFSLALSAGASGLWSDGTTAIGLFSRRGDTILSKEIILRFPIFLSKAYTRAQKGRVMYPNEFARLREEQKIENKVLYSPEEYEKIARFIDDGHLVTGEIFEYEQKKKDEEDSEEAIVPEKKFVFVRLHHYDCRTRKLVSFNIYSQPETVLVDMLRNILPLEKDRYLAKPITSGSKISVIVPLEPVSLNDFYVYLLGHNYDLRVLSGNDFSVTYLNELEPLRHIESRKISYIAPKVVDDFSIPPLSAAGDNEANRAEYNDFAGLWSKKVAGFDRELAKTLSGIRARTSADYLIVLRPDGKNSFARGFDLNQGGLIWFQDSFPAKSNSTGDVLEAMITEMQRPMVTLPEEQFQAIAEEKDRMTAQGASGGLASVAILDFYDRTNTVLYTWLSSSLSAAIDDSMKRIFEFERANEKNSLEVGGKLFKTPADVNAKTLKEFQKATGADYLIFGFYSVDPKTGSLMIDSKVYDLVRQKPIGGTITQSPVDVRLFNSVDEISQGIVQDIFSATQSQTK